MLLLRCDGHLVARSKTYDVCSCLMPERCRVKHKHLGHEPDHCTAARWADCCKCSDLVGAVRRGRFMGAQGARTQRRVHVLLLAGCACPQQSALATTVVFQPDVTHSQGMFCSPTCSNHRVSGPVFRYIGGSLCARREQFCARRQVQATQMLSPCGHICPNMVYSEVAQCQDSAGCSTSAWALRHSANGQAG